MSRNKVLFFSVTFTLLLGICLSGNSFILGQTDNVSSILANANLQVTSAFQAVKSADEAGANVTALISKLDEATSLLAQAENAYRAGNNNQALADANSALSIGEEVVTAAVRAEEFVKKNQNILLAVLYFSAASVLIILGLFLAWRFFKRYYIKNMIDAKPEVKSN